MQKLSIGEYIINVDDEDIDISPLLVAELGDGTKNTVRMLLQDFIREFASRLAKNTDLLAANLNAIVGGVMETRLIVKYKSGQDDDAVFWCLWMQMADQDRKESRWKIHAITLKEAEEEHGSTI